MSDTLAPQFNSFPFTKAIVVSLADTPLGYTTRAIRSVGGGTLKITCLDGSTPTLTFAANETRSICATQLWTTGSSMAGAVEALM